jgi:hypothetical protein
MSEGHVTVAVDAGEFDMYIGGIWQQALNSGDFPRRAHVSQCLDETSR